MITGEYDEGFSLNFNTEYSYSDKRRARDQQMCFAGEDGCEEESCDVYQELAEKDHYLLLAAEAGKILLEKNQELTDYYESLQENYLQKIEELEQEKHHLKRELTERENNYDSRMQDLQHDLTTLSGQVDMVQRTSKSFEQTHRSTYDDISIQNSSLLSELDQVKSYNNELAQQVNMLTKRLDARISIDSRSRNKYDNYDDTDGIVSHEAHGVNYMEMKSLKDQIKKLTAHKQILEETFSEIVREKVAISVDQTQTVGKVSNLEEQVLELQQQISICQSDLEKTKKKNVQLKDQLEEYVLIQSSQAGLSLNNSLFNELEMSLSEVDMNFQNVSTPQKMKRHADDEEVPEILISSVKEHANLALENLKNDLRLVYQKLKVLHNKLIDNKDDTDVEDMDLINGEAVTKLVDEVIHLIQDRVMSLGIIDARSDSPCRLDLEIENCDTLSQPDSQISDRDVDLLEQQVHDLNQRLNITTSELEHTKKELIATQSLARGSEEKAQYLTVKSNSQEREIDALRKEREIMMSDTTMEEKLRKALEEREESLKRENEIRAHFEQAQCDMQKLNNQLLTAVEHKLELSEQLEQWQFDMASLIDQQLSSKIKREQQKTRKRSGNSIPAKFFATKLFASRNGSKDTSQTNSPTVKSPVVAKK